MTIKNLKIGSKDISKMYIGKRISDTVYLGSEKVYENILGSVFDWNSEMTLLTSYDGTIKVRDSNSVVYEYNTNTISYIQGTLNGSGHSLAEIEYDQTPNGTLTIINALKIDKCDLTIRDVSSILVTGDRGDISLTLVDSFSSIFIVPTDYANISITQDDNSSSNIYVFANNCNFTINLFSNSSLYIIGNSNMFNILDQFNDSSLYINGNNNNLGAITLTNSTVNISSSSSNNIFILGEVCEENVWGGVIDEEPTNPTLPTRPTRPTPPTPEPI